MARVAADILRRYLGKVRLPIRVRLGPVEVGYVTDFEVP